MLRNGRREVRDHLASRCIAGEFAIRQGKWKLVLKRGSGGFSASRTVPGEAGGPADQLYNLRGEAVARPRAFSARVRSRGRGRG